MAQWANRGVGILRASESVRNRLDECERFFNETNCPAGPSAGRSTGM